MRRQWWEWNCAYAGGASANRPSPSATRPTSAASASITRAASASFRSSSARATTTRRRRRHALSTILASAHRRRHRSLRLARLALRAILPIAARLGDVPLSRTAMRVPRLHFAGLPPRPPLVRALTALGEAQQRRALGRRPLGEALVAKAIALMAA